MSNIAIHPSVDHGIAPAAKDFAGGTLVCKCGDRPVKVTITSQSAFNHACGCTKCWKPKGALFSVVAVAPRDKVSVTENGDKLAIVDPNAAILAPHYSQSPPPNYYMTMNVVVLYDPAKPTMKICLVPLFPKFAVEPACADAEIRS